MRKQSRLANICLTIEIHGINLNIRNCVWFVTWYKFCLNIIIILQYYHDSSWGLELHQNFWRLTLINTPKYCPSYSVVPIIQILLSFFVGCKNKPCMVYAAKMGSYKVQPYQRVVAALLQQQTSDSIFYVVISSV